jgi:hypothetical protein
MTPHPGRRHTLSPIRSIPVTALAALILGWNGGAPAQLPVAPQSDPFGIRMVYPTKSGTSPWVLNQADPTADPRFDPGAAITRNADGSWRIDDATARLSALAPAGGAHWKNVEMTGYVRLMSTTSPTDEFTWYARGERHSSSVPCDGSSYKGSIEYQGRTFWKKEVWHTGGYTQARGDGTATVTPLQGRWVGWKVMIYNIDSDSAVKMEAWLDDRADNQWVKVNEIVDRGGWAGGATHPDCRNPLTGRPRTIDEVILWGGSRATFRADEAVFDFKWLSVREIDVSGSLPDTTPPPAPANLRIVP